MDIDTLLMHFHESLSSVAAPRFFETERGFQGAILVELNKRIPNHALSEHTIIEQEHQKRRPDHHGLRCRPDIIIHEPFDSSRHTDRREGNIAVIELKLNASESEATEDFKCLAEMINVLHYPLGIFVNIASDETHHQLVPAEVKGRIVSFAVSLNNGHVRVIEERA